MKSTKISVHTHASENMARWKTILQLILKTGGLGVFSIFNCFWMGNSGGLLRISR